MASWWESLHEMFLREPESTIIQEVPLLGSLLYYCLLLVSGRCLRALTVLHVPKRWQQWLLDMITTFQVLGCSLENSQIQRFYGTAAYLAVMFCLAMWCVLTIENASSSPCHQLLKYLKGQTSGLDAVVSVLFQLAGGLLSYQYARQFWRLGLHSGHSERYEAQYCITSLQVEPPVGFVIEFGATMMDTLIFLVTLTPFYLCEVATKIFIMCYMVILGLHLTGMYMNPINATNQCFGCHGATVIEHLLVYWVAPLSATALSYKLYCRLDTIYCSWRTSPRQPSIQLNRAQSQHSTGQSKKQLKQRKGASQNDYDYIYGADKEIMSTTTITGLSKPCMLSMNRAKKRKSFNSKKESKYKL